MLTTVTIIYTFRSSNARITKKSEIRTKGNHKPIYVVEDMMMIAIKMIINGIHAQIIIIIIIIIPM